MTGKRRIWLVRTVFILISLTLAGGEAAAAATTTARRNAPTRLSAVKNSEYKKKGQRTIAPRGHSGGTRRAGSARSVDATLSRRF